ncbi:MAG: PQQ-like beta-propeller repeat protein [Armatimonadetes bacterium]|nr:PQQ-like beta-propeller repeat protein [Armatimonadota bacterium]
MTVASIVMSIHLIFSAGKVVEWTTFHYDNARTGAAPVDFPSADFKLLWAYELGKHTWRYCQGVSVWSSAPVVVRVGERMLAITGAYDHNVYAIDTASGKMVWRYTTGCVVNGALAFARLGGRPLVYVGSGDRSFYCLDAATGQKVWVRETMPWSFTVGDAVPSGPLVAQIDGRPVVYVGFWNSDKRSGRTVRRGDLFAFDAITGKTIWERRLGEGQVSSPALGMVNQRPVIYVGTEEGSVFALDAATGEIMWQFLTDHAITNSPTVATIAGQPVVFAANFFGMLYCLHGRTGRVLWKYKLGHEVRSTAAIARLLDTPVLFLGSLDRRIYAIAAKDTRLLWQFPTGKYVTASPVVVTVAGRPAVIAASLDNFLYVLEAVNGRPIWRYETGDMLWGYETRGSSLWSSPAVACDGKRPIIVFGGHDGKLYCFGAKPAAPGQVAAKASGAALSAGAPLASADDPRSRGPRALWLASSWAGRWLALIIAAALFSAGLIVVFLFPPSASQADKR